MCQLPFSWGSERWGTVGEGHKYNFAEGLKRVIYRFGSRMGNKSSQLSKKNLALLARNADMDENQVVKTVYNIGKSVPTKSDVFLGKPHPHTLLLLVNFPQKFPKYSIDGVQIH